MGVGHWTNNPVPEKDFVTETATEGIETTGCNGLSESLEDTQMNVSGEKRLETADRKMEVLCTKSKTWIGFWKVRTMYDTGKLAQETSCDAAIPASLESVRVDKQDQEDSEPVQARQCYTQEEMTINTKRW